MLQKVHQIGEAVSRLYLIWVDRGYSGSPFLMWVMDAFRWVVQVVLRPEQTVGLVVLKKRWIVERTFGWLNWYRRLSKDYERLPANSQGDDLHFHDSTHAQAVSLILYFLKLFKQPLSSTLSIYRKRAHRRGCSAATSHHFQRYFPKSGG